MDATKQIISRYELFEFLLTVNRWIDHAANDSWLVCPWRSKTLRSIQRFKVVVSVSDMPLLGNTWETVLHFILSLVFIILNFASTINLK